MGRKKFTVREEDVSQLQGGVGGKFKKKNLVIDDDEYFIGIELFEEF